MTALPNIDNIANAMYETAANSRDKQPPRRYLGMSAIGAPCDRALWLNFRGFPQNPIDGRIIMLFRFGDRIEEEVVHWLNKSGYRVEGQQSGFEDFNGFFRGHCDGIIHGVTKQPHILEIKSANDKKFKAFKAAGVRVTYPTYYAQCQCYMGYSGLERALVVVQNKNTSELYTERIYFNRDDFIALQNRAKNIITSTTPPDRMFSEKSIECRWCSSNLACRNGDSILVKDQICGTCRYLTWMDLHPWCCHPDHPVKIATWGVGCPQWINIFDHNTGHPERKKIREGKTDGV